jgi:cytochrome b involved in lipid metabolism
VGNCKSAGVRGGASVARVVALVIDEENAERRRIEAEWLAGWTQIQPLTRHAVASTAATGQLLVILHSAVYDLTRFACTHRGGPLAIERRAGTDASVDFDRKHRKSTKATLNSSHPHYLGPVVEVQ